MLDVEGPSKLSMQPTLLWLVQSICLLFHCCFSAGNFASTSWLSLRVPPFQSVSINSETCWALFPHSSPYLFCFSVQAPSPCCARQD